MSWDPVWDEIFRARRWGAYPPEELVRFVAHSFADRRSRGRVLELGCGAGANLWFLAREGFDVYGIDGSPSAIEQARARLTQEGCSASFEVGDFTDLSRYEPRSFAAVVDVAALQHNDEVSAVATVEQAAQLLGPGGRMFSMLVAVGSWGDGEGIEVESRTFTDIREGPLAGVGRVRFRTLEDVEALFAPFADVSIEYSERTLEQRTRAYGHWVVTAARPR